MGVVTTWNIVEGEAPTWDAIEALGSWDALEALAWQAAAAGGSASTGSAAVIIPVLRAAAAGASVSAGSVAATLLLRAAAAGSSTSAGSSGPIIPTLRAAASGASATLGQATARRTRTSSLPPTTILASTNLAGVVADVRDDPAAPDTGALTAVVATTATLIRLAIDDPGGDPAPGPDEQAFRVLVTVR